MYKQIINSEPDYNDTMDADIIILIKDLLQKKPADRPKISECKKYKIFEDVDWEKVKNKKHESPIMS